ncbi:MAG: hypothetical protein DIU78_023865 [Pseudomonadota bacterium]|nr:MAG: hypothetical protein DIU78_25125 [Pseudomonadota bacterium]
MPRRMRLLPLVASLSLGALGVACRPAIGDECESSVDCSQGGDRLCDLTQPGGYCTIFDCEQGTCPDDSVCVAFGTQLSPLPGCASSDFSRFTRTFCMAPCESNEDCRSGYVCEDVGVPGNPWSAVVLDTDRSQRVCIVPYSAERLPEDRPTDVCAPGEPATAPEDAS